MWGGGVCTRVFGVGGVIAGTVHCGHAPKVHAQRQRVLEAAYVAHPERFVRGLPTAPTLPEAVWINKPETAARSGLDQTLELLRPGDTLVVWRLDRLGRSLKHLIGLMGELEEQGIGFRSLQESIDTTSSGGKLIFHMFGALAEFERNLIRERTRAGLAAARARGRQGGRPEALDKRKQQMAVDLYHQKKHTVQEICQSMGITPPTFYRYLGKSQENPDLSV